MQDESQFVLVFVVSSLIILLILILVILFVIAYQKRVATQRIKLDTIEREHQLQLLQATLTVQERERKRIASDLHDDIGSLLSALKLNVQFLEGSETNEKQRQFLEKTRIKLESGIEQVRQISHDMYPPTLQKLGLWEALKDFLSGIHETNHLKTKMHGLPENLRLGAETELAIYRVLQELVTNSIRHSGATELQLEVIQKAKTLDITYADNGKGMDETVSKKGLGFLNMRSRVEAINGSITFTSEEEKGSKAIIKLNL